MSFSSLSSSNFVASSRFRLISLPCPAPQSSPIPLALPKSECPRTIRDRRSRSPPSLPHPNTSSSNCSTSNSNRRNRSPSLLPRPNTIQVNNSTSNLIHITNISNQMYITNGNLICIGTIQNGRIQTQTLVTWKRFLPLKVPSAQRQHSD